jgi:hypothetical protein
MGRLVQRSAALAQGRIDLSTRRRRARIGGREPIAAFAIMLVVWLGCWLASTSACASDPLVATPEMPARGALAIASVDVQLELWRGGETRPDGTRVLPGAAWAQGVVSYSLDRPAHDGERVRLLDFAAAMAKEPAHVDEVALAAYVDGPFQPGGMTVTGHWGLDTLQIVGPRADLVVRLAAGTTSFTLRYELDVPHRYWPFGCVRGRCSLSGALAPLPSVPARGGVYLPEGGRVIAPARWTVHAELATPGDVRPGAGPEHRNALLDDRVLVAGGSGETTAYPSVFFGHWHESSQWHRGARVRVFTMQPRPSAQVPDDRRSQLRSDLAGITLAIGGEIIDVLGALGQPPRPDETLVVVQGPLRAQVAQMHPGVVLISDQAFQLFPARRFRKFHEDAIARALADALVEPRMRGRHDPSTDLWLSGALGFAVLQLWRTARDQRDEFAHDILSRLTFVPAVDRFLYTQQASFSSAYFRGVEDEMPVRNHPLWWAHQLPTGRRLHEKLSDTIGRAGIDGFYRELLAHPSRDPLRIAQQVWKRDLDWFFAQWLGPYPAVDYSVVDVDSKRVGDAWSHRIRVRKHSSVPMVEPVQVLVTERGGKAHFLVWNGELGARADAEPDANAGSAVRLAAEPTDGEHVFELRTAQPLKSVRVDPRTRTLQHALPPKDNVDPLFDDRHPAAFRFLYTGVGLSIAASEFLSARTPTARLNAISGFASFEGSLRRDLRRTGHVLIARDRETDIALGMGANFWFGDKINRQRRRARVRTFATVALLNGRSLDPRGGLRLIETVALIDDTRGFYWWPERGRLLSLSATLRHTLRVEGTHDDRHDIVIDASWTQMWRLAKDHVIATSVYLETVVPLVRRPEFRGLARVGGIGGLSGYNADEAFGLGVANVQVEYRHVFVNDMRLNFAHLAWLRSLGGILFAGAASASQCDSLKGWFAGKSWYGTVGYALTGYLSILGVTPQIIRLELAVPLVRYRNERCLDKALPNYLAEVQGVPDARRLLPPVTVNVTFQQSF